MDENPCPPLLLHAWILSGFCKYSARCHNFFEFMCACALLYLENSVSLALPTTSESHNLSVPLLCEVSWAFDGGKWYVPLRIGHTIISYSLQVESLWFSVLNAIYYKKFLNWEMYCNESLGVLLVLWAVRKIVVVGFSSANDLSSHKFLSSLTVSSIDSTSWSGI